MPLKEFLTGCRRAATALVAAVDEREKTVPGDEITAAAVDRGVFRPAEEAALLSWFARFLTIRSELREVIGDVSAPVDGRVEAVYRAFDGLGSIEITLQERSGRPTLSAENLLDLAFAGRGSEAIAVYGGPSCPERLVEGEEAREAISEPNRVSHAVASDHDTGEPRA